MKKQLRWVMMLFIGVALTQSIGLQICNSERLAYLLPPKVPSQWVEWTVRSVPVFSGQYKVASDPSILYENGIYRMFHTALDTQKTRTIIAQAVSADGISWTYSHTNPPFYGSVLSGIDGTQAENLEASYVVKISGAYYLYYSGYRDNGNPMRGFPASLFLARSVNGALFTRYTNQPVLSPTKGSYDNDAVYSPTLLRYGNSWVMIYTGHCYTDHSKIEYPGVFLLAATSPDGLNWTKRQAPVLKPGNPISWMKDGAAEACIVQGPDSMFYLFFTGLEDEERVLGIARSNGPYGPWEINPNPIIWPRNDYAFMKAQVLAPHVIIESQRVRLWFMGVNAEGHFAIGYAEASWPLFRGTQG